MTARRGLLLVLGLAASWAAAMVLLQQARFEAGFHYEYEDDALSHQMLWNVGRGELLENSIHPLHRPSHLEAVLVLLWPFYAALAAVLGAWPAVWTLKAAVLASGALAAWGLTRREGLGETAAVVWSGVYLALPATIALALSTFRPLALSAAPLLFLLWAFRARHFGGFLAAVLVTLSFREDLALSVVPLAAVALWRRMPPRFALTALLVPAAWFLVATQIVLPAVLPARYEDIVFAANVGPSLWDRLMDPTHAVGLLALVVPVLGLPLLAPEAVIGLASLGAVAIFKGGFAGNLLHFIGPATAASIGGAVIAHAWLSKRSPRAAALPWAALAAALLVHVTPTGLALVATDCAHNGPAPEPSLCGAWSPFDPRFTTPDAREPARAAAAARIPAGATVAAVGHLLPRLTPRATLWEYGHADVPFADADWLILEEVDRYAGAGRYLALEPGALARHWPILSRAFELVSADQGVRVLRRTHNVAGLSDLLRPLFPKRTASPEHQRGVRSPGESREQR